MKKELNYQYPFWQWGELGFFNCYASVYLCLQGKNNGGNYKCTAKEGKGCNDCNNCSDTLNNIFATIKGQWATRQSWSGKPTKIQKEFDDKFGNDRNAPDELIDFIFGFTGYDYEKKTNGLKESVVASINADKPVIVKSKIFDNNMGAYRIISGYEGDTLIEPNYAPAAQDVKQLMHEDIECIYVFGEKNSAKYTFVDFLKIIEKAMDSDFANGIWYDFLKKFDYEGEKLWEVNAAEIKNRFKRLRDVMGWVPNIGHGLQTAFRDKELLAAFGADVNRCGELFEVIGHQTHLMHNRGYMLSAICDSINALNINDAGDWPWDKHGLITATWQILDSIMDCDLKILLAIKKVIRKIST